MMSLGFTENTNQNTFGNSQGPYQEIGGSITGPFMAPGAHNVQFRYRLASFNFAAASDDILRGSYIEARVYMMRGT